MNFKHFNDSFEFQPPFSAQNSNIVRKNKRMSNVITCVIVSLLLLVLLMLLLYTINKSPKVKRIYSEVNEANCTLMAIKEEYQNLLFIFNEKEKDENETLIEIEKKKKEAEVYIEKIKEKDKKEEDSRDIFEDYKVKEFQKGIKILKINQKKEDMNSLGSYLIDLKEKRQKLEESLNELVRNYNNLKKNKV